MKPGYYYKHKKTGELVLAIGYGWAYSNLSYDHYKCVRVKDPVTDYEMLENVLYFEYGYEEYNP